MREHLIYFFSGKDFYHKQNQIIGFEGIVDDLELIEYGKKCYNIKNKDGIIGETGTILLKNTTIIPFSYSFEKGLIIKHLEDVITANELYIHANTLKFPLMKLKTATRNFPVRGWCCVGHYYLSLLNIALHNKGYNSEGVKPSGMVSNFNNKLFTKTDGAKLKIDAWAGM